MTTVAKRAGLVVGIATAAALAVGCRANAVPGENVSSGNAGIGGTEVVQYIHDDKRGVGCWFYAGTSTTSISCLADKDYVR